MRESPLKDNVPVVSVVIPAFNAEKWLTAAVDSVLNQSLDNWELLVVDDGSTDGTVAIISRVNDPRVRLVSQENQGPTAARNTGFSNCRGQYVALLDADDQYETQFLERTVDFLDQNPSFGFVATDQFLIARDGRKTTAFTISKHLPTTDCPIAVDYCRVRMRERCFPSNTALVLRRSLIDRLGGYESTLFGGEEMELVLRWTRETRLGYIPHPLVSHFDRPGSFIKDLERSVDARVHLWHQILRLDNDYVKAHPGYSLLRNMCLFRLTAIAIAGGYFKQAAEVASYWPDSPRDRFWWFGKTLSSLPKAGWHLIHAVLGRTDTVRLRNDPGARDLR